VRGKTAQEPCTDSRDNPYCARPQTRYAGTMTDNVLLAWDIMMLPAAAAFIVATRKKER
jgi:hypothetical protein